MKTIEYRVLLSPEPFEREDSERWAFVTVTARSFTSGTTKAARLAQKLCTGREQVFRVEFWQVKS